MGRLVIENVGQSFEKDKGEATDALRDVNFEVKDGEFVCIICLLYTSPSPRD